MRGRNKKYLIIGLSVILPLFFILSVYFNLFNASSSYPNIKKNTFATKEFTVKNIGKREVIRSNEGDFIPVPVTGQEVTAIFNSTAIQKMNYAKENNKVFWLGFKDTLESWESYFAWNLELNVYDNYDANGKGTKVDYALGLPNQPDQTVVDGNSVITHNTTPALGTYEGVRRRTAVSFSVSNIDFPIKSAALVLKNEGETSPVAVRGFQAVVFVNDYEKESGEKENMSGISDNTFKDIFNQIDLSYAESNNDSETFNIYTPDHPCLEITPSFSFEDGSPLENVPAGESRTLTFTTKNDEYGICAGTYVARILDQESISQNTLFLSDIGDYSEYTISNIHESHTIQILSANIENRLDESRDCSSKDCAEGMVCSEIYKYCTYKTSDPAPEEENPTVPDSAPAESGEDEDIVTEQSDEEKDKVPDETQKTERSIRIKPQGEGFVNGLELGGLPEVFLPVKTAELTFKSKSGYIVSLGICKEGGDCVDQKMNNKSEVTIKTESVPSDGYIFIEFSTDTVSVERKAITEHQVLFEADPEDSVELLTEPASGLVESGKSILVEITPKPGKCLVSFGAKGSVPEYLDCIKTTLSRQIQIEKDTTFLIKTAEPIVDQKENLSEVAENSFCLVTVRNSSLDGKVLDSETAKEISDSKTVYVDVGDEFKFDFIPAPRKVEINSSEKMNQIPAVKNFYIFKCQRAGDYTLKVSFDSAFTSALLPSDLGSRLGINSFGENLLASVNRIPSLVESGVEGAYNAVNSAIEMAKGLYDKSVDFIGEVLSFKPQRDGLV